MGNYIKTSNSARRVALVVASVALCIHTAAMIMGPAPKSLLRDRLFPLVSWYMDALHMSNGWAFFAPMPLQYMSHFSYVVTTREGTQSVFSPEASMSRRQGTYLRYMNLFGRLFRNPEMYQAGIARHLCFRHQEVQPHSIRLRFDYQRVPTSEKYLDHDDAWETETLGPFFCTEEVVR